MDGLHRTPSDGNRRPQSGAPVARVRRRAERLPFLAATALISLVVSVASAIAAEPLPTTANVELSWGGPEWSIEVDLGTLPTRPVLIVEATPDASHPDMAIQIEVTNYQVPWGWPGAICPSPESSDIGWSRLEVPWYTCQPGGGYPGTTATVIVRAIDFGVAGDPASVSIQLVGATRPPTETLAQNIDTSLTPRSDWFFADKDTVLYQDGVSSSDGAGQFLWAGRKTTGFLFSNVYPRHSLLSFDLTGLTPLAPVIEWAVLHLEVINTAPAGFSEITHPLEIHRIAASPTGTWAEGDADAPGDEFDGAFATFGADWEFRSRPFGPWSVPGGDPTGDPLVSVGVNQPGSLYLGGPGIRDAIQDMVSSATTEDGFVLSSPGGPALFAAMGIQFASLDHPIAAHRPGLEVLYTPTRSQTAGEIDTGVENFFDEGQNFRWIYDLDQDDILVTNIGGVCEVVEHPPSQSAPLPYRYTYGGSPGFTGVDCCTWRIDSADTGTIGTGQALFFHNLDAGNPANMPPDTDQDGIRNLCDNCPSTPNGPLRGSCKTGTAIGASCRSDQECAGAGLCDLAQEDTDGNFQGNACPEPGFAAGLLAGLGLLAAWTRARRSGSAT